MAYVSSVVMEEISKGDKERAKRRLAEVSKFRVLEVNRVILLFVMAFPPSLRRHMPAGIYPKLFSD